MKVLGFIIAACLALALLRGAIIVLFLMVLVGFISLLFTRPREAFGLLSFCLIAGLFQSQPLACLGVIALITFVGAFRRP